MEIRKANVADAQEIIRIHHDAVHLTAAADYDAEILDDWSSSLFEERLLKMQVQLSENPEHTYLLVAEVDNRVVGFGEVVPHLEELRAVYVAPTAGRAGVGGKIVRSLEAAARERGAFALWLDSSLTALLFYRALGYESEGTEALHQLRSGRQMRCVKMRKSLYSV